MVLPLRRGKRFRVPRRALVTASIRDFMPIGARYRAASRSHAGLVMVSS